MSSDLLIDIAWKSLLCAGLTLLWLRLDARHSAAERSVVAHAGLIATLLIPIASSAMPVWTIEAPASWAGTIGVQASEAVSASTMLPLAEATVTSSPVAGVDWVIAGYAIPTALLLGILFSAIVRLRFLRVRARAPADSRWFSAMADAERKMKVRPGVRLLVSGELTSPISWGIARPVIVLTEQSHADVEKAPALILHEMAHVARFDWAKLVLARVATALFWFNPLVWALARQCHELREEAADDAVLMTDFSGADYAALLISAVAYEHKGGFTMANNVAPKRGSVRRRVLRALDEGRSRMPARPAWTASCCAAIATVSVSLSAANPVFAHAGSVVAEAPKSESSVLPVIAPDAPVVRAARIADAPSSRPQSPVAKGPGVITYQDPVTGKTIHRAPKGQGVVTYQDAVTGQSGVRLATNEELAELRAALAKQPTAMAAPEVTSANIETIRAAARRSQATVAAKATAASARPRGPGRLVPHGQGAVSITGDASMVALPNGDVMVYDDASTN